MSIGPVSSGGRRDRSKNDSTKPSGVRNRRPMLSHWTVTSGHVRSKRPMQAIVCIQELPRTSMPDVWPRRSCRMKYSVGGESGRWPIQNDGTIPCPTTTDRSGRMTMR